MRDALSRQMKIFCCWLAVDLRNQVHFTLVERRGGDGAQLRGASLQVEVTFDMHKEN